MSQAKGQLRSPRVQSSQTWHVVRTTFDNAWSRWLYDILAMTHCCWTELLLACFASNAVEQGTSKLGCLFRSLVSNSALSVFNHCDTAAKDEIHKPSHHAYFPCACSGCLSTVGCSILVVGLTIAQSCCPICLPQIKRCWRTYTMLQSISTHQLLTDSQYGITACRGAISEQKGERAPIQVYWFRTT